MIGIMNALAVILCAARDSRTPDPLIKSPIDA